MNFKHTLSSLSVLLIALFAIYPNLVSAEDIRIGAITSLTGNAADQGKNWISGARLAEEELKKRGLPLKFIVEDDATNPAKSVSAFRKLHDFDHVQAILGGTWDFLAEAVVPLATAEKLPFLTMTNPIEILSKTALASPYVFTNALSIQATEVAMREFLRVKKPKSVAILTPTFPFTLAHADLAAKLCKEAGIPVAMRVDFSYDDFFQTIKVLATKVVLSKADLVFIFVSAQGLDPFMQTVYQQQGHPLVLTTQHLDAAFAGASEKAAYKNAYGIYPKVVDDDFYQRYHAKYGEEPRVYAAEGYDALMFVAQAFEKHQSLTDEKASFEYAGVTGTYSLPAKTHQLGNISAAIVTTSNGKFEAAKEFSGLTAK